MLSHTINPIRVMELLHYNSETGFFTRKVDNNRGRAGFVFGFDSHNIKLDGIECRRGHLAWVLITGSWPPKGYWIDHINGVKADNSWLNLRLATPTQNQYNKAGYGTYSKGVTWRDRNTKPWQAKIRVSGKRIHLGSFTTEQEAAQAYQEACLKYHGEFACQN